MVQVHVVYEDEVWLHMVMELCPRLDLFDRISRRGSLLSEAEVDVVAVM